MALLLTACEMTLEGTQHLHVVWVYGFCSCPQHMMVTVGKKKACLGSRVS